MTPLTSAFGRSLTTSAQPPVPSTESQPSPKLPEHLETPEKYPFSATLPDFNPSDWKHVPKPLRTRDVSSGAESTNKLPAPTPTSPPYVSGSSVDRIIDQYTHQSSSAAQLQGAVYGSTSDVEHFAHQNEKHAEGTLGVMPSHPAPARANFWEHADTPPPQIPLPADPPCRPSTPFYRPDTPRPHKDGPIPCVIYSTVRKPLSVSDDSCDKEDEAQKAQNNGLRVVESTTASDAESGVAQLTAPPQRMHSARRARTTRRRSMQSALTSSPGDCFSEDSDDDPFKYDVFVRPSKEREVSACLRKVSGLQRESRASIYSEDGTPSKTFGHHFELFGQTVSPEMQQSFDSCQVESVPRSLYDDQPVEVEDGRFYNPNAIKSGWAVGSPNEVKIPVNNNLFGRAKQNLADPSGPFSHNQLAWEQLRRRDELQAHRLTGNTDD